MLGQPVIVENKPGAGGITASQHVHRPPLTDEEKAKTPPVSHPALRTHPVSGRKAVYVGEGLTRTMEGMPEDEGRRLVVEISQFATQPQFVYRHKWRVNASHDGRGRDAALRARRPAHHQDKETRMKNYL